MYTNKEDLLQKAKDLLKEEVTKISYLTWIKNIEIKSIVDNKITLVALSDMQKDAIENRYYDLIINTFNFITNKNCDIQVIVKSSDTENEVEEEVKDYTLQENYKNTFLNPKYTFDNFVIGNNNKFAQAAAYAVVENYPETVYNPLFIYGGVGLGKTHLMQAVGNELIKRFPNTKVLYTTSEQFINELVKSIQDKNYKTELFRNKYRNIDVLLIDDIQFLENKKTGQEEFFHTFQALHQSGKQVVLTCDRPPRDVGVDERLKSRLDMGILADVSKPDYETRLAILRKKVLTERIIIDDYILSVIATKIESNVRELEGVLNKIVAIASLTHNPISIEIAERAINEVILQKEKVISSDYIQEIVAKYFNIDKKDLISPKKSKDIAYPRQISMYLCRDIAGMSFPAIGDAFGGRDHTTVMHACNKIEKEIKENTNTKLIVDSVKNIINDSK